MKPEMTLGPSEPQSRDPCNGGQPLACAKQRLPTLAAFVIAVASTVVLTLAGCANPQGIAPHALPLAPAQVGLVDATAFPVIAPNWWTAFGDSDLSALIERALADSPTLNASQARIERAAANVAAARAAEGPQVTGAFDATRQRFSANGLYPPPLAGSIRGAMPGFARRARSSSSVLSTG